MLPVRRDYHFNLPADRICDWHPRGRQVTHFFNALSVFFPEGERFFIHSVRHFRERITDPELAKAVVGFIGQEAMHGREHTEYNELTAAAGLPTRELEAKVTRVLEFFKRVESPARQLSGTIALEHLTAIMADHVLSEPRVLAGAEPHYARLWRWHALEETEHKAVAFDVYTAVMGRGLRAYLIRILGLLSASAIFWSLVFRFHLRMIRADAEARGWRGWWRLLGFLFGPIGVFPRILLPWLAYFRPGFHPWDHDNRRYLKQLDQLEAELASEAAVG